METKERSSEKVHLGKKSDKIAPRVMRLLESVVRRGFAVYVYDCASGSLVATNSGSLSRVTSELQSGLNPVPTEKFDLWTNYLTNRGVKFEIGTPNALSKLETNNAYGLFETKYNWETNTHTPTIYLPENPNASVFYEESLHALDYLRGTPREINRKRPINSTYPR